MRYVPKVPQWAPAVPKDRVYPRLPMFEEYEDYGLPTTPPPPLDPDVTMETVGSPSDEEVEGSNPPPPPPEPQDKPTGARRKYERKKADSEALPTRQTVKDKQLQLEPGLPAVTKKKRKPKQA
ncbi:MAG: hypothetical protein AAFU03_10055, partial [Bacteroidota bacterium]